MSQQKDAGTLDKVKIQKKKKNFGEIADMAFCIVADDICKTSNFSEYFYTFTLHHIV